MLLAIDTSSFVLSCALAEEDKLVAEWTVQQKMTHSEQLIPHMDIMLKDAGVDKKEITAVAVSKGPGSFTGLRIGLVTAKTMACLWNVPVIGVDTLEALAYNLAGSETFALPMADAQRGNVYAAIYGVFSEIWQEKKTEAAPIDQVIEAAIRHGGPMVVLGEGADIYKDKIIAAGLRPALPQNRCCRASSVAMAAWKKLKKGEADDPLTLLPNYIRRSEAEVQWEKKQGIIS